MDQLITYGPVVSDFTVYDDFYYFKDYPYCKNIIYKRSKNYNKAGGHAVIIVGYGVENDIYYWIAQNSRGENFCDGGFFKVEFGQANIEKVTLLKLMWKIIQKENKLILILMK